MSTKMKRKVKIKKKNMAIFISFILVFTFAIYEIGYVIVKVITTSKEPKVEEKVKEKKEIKKKEPKTELSTYEEKLNKLDNINKEINYFREENIDRYIKYKEENPEIGNIQIIKDVNMNLDLTPYDDKIKAINLDTEIILVNKYYYLNDNYIPDNLERIKSQYALSGMKLVDYAKDAFEDMASAAAKKDLNIVAMSTYRSYNYQVNLYKRYAREDGAEKADTYSGRPGHSEHQTGLAVDVYNQKETYTNFEKTDEFDWMQEHAHEYGFILRFPKDKVRETGYVYESWHYRYVGKEIAKYIKENNISLEEYIATH